MKVSHANTILQLVDPAYAAVQEHAKTLNLELSFLVSFTAKLLLGRMYVGVDDRETNPPLGFKSKASIFHAQGRNSNSDTVER